MSFEFNLPSLLHRFCFLRWIASFCFQVGKWDDASSTIEKLWGKENVEEAIKELRNANINKEEEASWSELLTKRYFKGKLSHMPCPLSNEFETKVGEAIR